MMSIDTFILEGLLKVLDEYEILESVKKNYKPQEIFEAKELSEWAIKNGFIKTSSQDSDHDCHAEQK